MGTRATMCGVASSARPPTAQQRCLSTPSATSSRWRCASTSTSTTCQSSNATIKRALSSPRASFRSPGWNAWIPTAEDRCARYTRTSFYTQLSYFQSLFDVEHATKQLSEETREMGSSVVAGHQDEFRQLYDHVDKYLQKSARKHVDLGALFSTLGLALPQKK